MPCRMQKKHRSEKLEIHFPSAKEMYHHPHTKKEPTGDLGEVWAQPQFGQGSQEDSTSWLQVHLEKNELVV